MILAKKTSKSDFLLGFSHSNERVEPHLTSHAPHGPLWRGTARLRAAGPCSLLFALCFGQGALPFVPSMVR